MTTARSIRTVPSAPSSRPRGRGRVPFTLALLLGLIGSLVLVWTPMAAQATPANPLWVAMGDSYSSGEGTFLYDTGTDLGRPTGNGCHRGPYAYARQMSSRGWMPYTLNHVACSGAEIEHYGIARADEGHPWGEPPQRSALGPNVDLVTASFGGNDVGFGEIARDCLKIMTVLQSCGAKYGDTNDNGVWEAGETDVVGAKIASTERALGTLYRSMLADAPNAEVVIVGYPRIFDPNPTLLCAYNTRTVTLFNQWTDRLNRAIASTINAIGNPRLRFADITDMASGRELCSSAPPIEYFTGVVEALVNSDKYQAIHPNYLGNEAMAFALCKQLENCSPPLAVSLMLVIDSSGSMKDTDPTNRRLQVASDFLSTVLPGDKVGVVDFDSSARVAASPTIMPAGAPVVSRAINAINADGATNVGAGLTAACNALKASSKGRAGAVLLLTDGDGSYSGQASCLKDNGWPVFAIALGTGIAAVNASALLKTIASTTGGSSRTVEEADGLLNEFLLFRAGLLADKLGLFDVKLLLQPSQTIKRRFPVLDSSAKLNAAATWPGSDVQVTLVSPSGRRYDRNTVATSVLATHGPTYELYSIDTPEPGEWTAEIFGADVSANEPVRFTASSVTAPGIPPVAAGKLSTTSVTPGGTVRFDARASTDADDAISQYLWDAGDGSGLTAGPVVDHVYSTAGTYGVRLVVLDSSGHKSEIAVGTVLVDANATSLAVGLTSLATPVRLLDTRPGAPTIDGQQAGGGLRKAGTTLEVSVAGRGGVPTNATAAVLNLTVTGSTGSGYATVFPCGGPAPNASNINFTNGETRANTVTTTLGTNGTACIYTSAPTHLIIDAAGTLGSSFAALATPARLADTRPGGSTVDGVRAGSGLVSTGTGTVLTVPITGRAGVAVGATTAFVNVTVPGPFGGGYLTAFPCGQTPPNASNLNFTVGQTVAAATVVGLDDQGRACFYVSTHNHVIVDVAGTIDTSFSPLPAPARLLDTRPGAATADGRGGGIGFVNAGYQMSVRLTDRTGVTTSAGAMALTLTATGTTGSGYVTAWPCDTARPTASTLNFAAGETVANQVITRLPADGRLCLYTSAGTHLIVDVAGTFS